MNIEWDPDKNTQNQAKHGLSFEEAPWLFTSKQDYLEIFDRAHSEDEDRFIAIGLVLKNVIVIIWTERDEATIRIISARRATSRECLLFRKHVDQDNDR